jgi:hypothetical protein
VCRLAGAIVLDKSSNGHRLHRPRENSDSGVVDAGRDAEQNDRSCALSFVVAFAMGYSRRQLLANAIEQLSTRQ